MRVLPFTKYSPCGNTTILVRESSLSPADRARVAAEIIAPGHLEAEQAGYVDTAPDRAGTAQQHLPDAAPSDMHPDFPLKNNKCGFSFLLFLSINCLFYPFPQKNQVLNEKSLTFLKILC